MSDQRDGLKEEYKGLLFTTGDERTFQEKCIDFLNDFDVNNCFKLLPFGEIQDQFLKKALESEKEVTFSDLEEVFKIFERYARNLFIKPWCKDFRTIKTCSGFLKYKVEKWLPLAAISCVLKLIGYMCIKGTFKYVETVDTDRVLAVGFELYLAHTHLFVLALQNNVPFHKYSKDDIPKSYTTNTSSLRMLMSKFPNFSELSSSSSVQDIDKTHHMTTALEHLHYDKDGHLTAQKDTSRDPSSHGFQNAENYNAWTEPSSLTSLLNVELSEKELYGDSADMTACDGWSTAGNGQWEQFQHNQSQSGVHASMHPNFLLNSNEYTSSNGRYMYESKVRYQNDARETFPKPSSVSFDHSSDPNSSFTVSDQGKKALNKSEDLKVSEMEHSLMHGRDNQKTQPPENKSVTDNMSGYFSTLDREIKRVQNILDSRIKHLARNQKCSFCRHIPVVECVKCGKMACKGCVDTLRQSPCLHSASHKYEPLESNSDLGKVESDAAQASVSNLSHDVSDVAKISSVQPGSWV